MMSTTLHSATPAPLPAGSRKPADPEDESSEGRLLASLSAEPDTAWRWCQALEQARRDPNRERLNSQLLHLVSWPNLTRLPPETALPVARICALLWQKRTAGFLVPRVLDLPPEECLPLLHALQSLGHVDTGTPSGALHAGAASGVQAATQPPRPLQRDSLLAQLWRRLKVPH